MASKRIKWIAETAVLTAVLLVLQFATKPMGQLVTGSCVNTVLAMAVLVAGLPSGFAVAVISPFFAFLLGIGPQLFPLTPAIAAGNCVFVLLLRLLYKDGSMKATLLPWLIASFGKFLSLNLLIVQILCRVLELAEKQIAIFSAMFSWPQLITALVGSGIALLIAPRIKTAMKKK